MAKNNLYLRTRFPLRNFTLPTQSAFGQSWLHHWSNHVLLLAASPFAAAFKQTVVGNVATRCDAGRVFPG